MLRNTLNTFITATLIMLLGVSSSAQAIVPMGDLMGSTSVTWGNKEETTELSALRVDLAPAEPTIKEDGDTEDREVEGNKVTVTYTITSRANGPDKYTLAAPYDSNAEGNENAGVLGTEILGAEGQDSASVILGATAATDSTDSTTITVICDENYRSNSAINCNGIEATDTVIIGDGDTAYTVAEGGVSNPGGEVPSTIRLNDVPVGILLGTRIAEQKTFKVVVSGNALLDPAEQVTFALNVTGTSTDGNQIGTANLAHTIEGAPDMPTVERYVRNLTDPTGNPAPGSAEEIEFDSGGLHLGEDLGRLPYYKTGVSAKQDHVVQFLIVLKAGNQGPQTDIVLNETLSPFVQFVPGSPTLDGDDWVSGSVLIDSNQLTMRGEGVAPLNIANKSSAKVTYKVKVIGGDEAVLDGDGTTAVDGGNNAEQQLVDDGRDADPLPHGTLWKDVPEGRRTDHIACWCAGQSWMEAGDVRFVDYCGKWGNVEAGKGTDPEWVVGVNEYERDGQEQVEIRDWADNRYPLFMSSDAAVTKCR